MSLSSSLCQFQFQTRLIDMWCMMMKMTIMTLCRKTAITRAAYANAGLDALWTLTRTVMDCAFKIVALRKYSMRQLRFLQRPPQANTQRCCQRLHLVKIPVRSRRHRPVKIPVRSRRQRKVKIPVHSRRHRQVKIQVRSRHPHRVKIQVRCLRRCSARCRRRLPVLF